MPVNADVPDIQAIFVANDERNSNPLGVKGVGELPMVGVAAAIANAVYHATGVRVRKVPIRIEDVLVLRGCGIFSRGDGRYRNRCVSLGASLTRMLGMPRTPRSA